MNMPSLLNLCCLIVWAGWVLRAAGEVAIEGTVRLPPRKAEVATGPRYQINHAAAIVAPDPPAAVVYLEGPFAEAPPPSRPVELRQKGYQFSPGLLPIQRGTTVAFPNLDDEYHSVFSYSKPKRFDLGRYRKDEEPAAQKFDQCGVVKLYCEIHEHMRATILVLDTPHFTKTQPDGAYRLERLPAGQYKLKAWIDEKTVWEKPVDLKEGQTLRVDFDGK